MIDIHTHILPRFDDGAKDLATSEAMLRAELAQGVDTLVLTSHYYGKKRSPQGYLEKRAAAYEQLSPHIPEGLDVRLGAEVHFTGVNMPEYEELAKLTIEGTNYILIEFSFTRVWTNTLMETLADFIDQTHCIPIIAHVERYSQVQKNPTLCSELMEMGCLLQVNAASFLEKEARGLAFALLKHGYAHCIGSDTHDMGERAPKLALARRAVEKAKLLPEWEMAQALMKRIVAGEQVCVERGKPIKKFFGKYI